MAPGGHRDRPTARAVATPIPVADHGPAMTFADLFERGAEHAATERYAWSRDADANACLYTDRTVQSPRS